jgi:hypothetical protein
MILRKRKLPPAPVQITKRFKRWDTPWKEDVNNKFMNFILDKFGKVRAKESLALILDGAELRTRGYMNRALEKDDEIIYIPNCDYEDFREIEKKETRVNTFHMQVGEFLHLLPRGYKFPIVWLDYNTTFSGGEAKGRPQNDMRLLFDGDNPKIANWAIFGITICPRTNDKVSKYRSFEDLERFIECEIENKKQYKFTQLCEPLSNGKVKTVFYEIRRKC